MEQVNEKSTAYLTITFRDKAGAAQAPASARYSIHDVGSGEEIRGETEIATPGSTVEITLTPEDNRLLRAGSSERRRVTVTAEYGSEDAVKAEYAYRVVNLASVS